MTTYQDYDRSQINDDWETPLYAWKQIEEYIPKDKEIWCPFFYNGNHKLKELFDIIHIDEDFFENDRGDIVVDNPPFSIKKSVIQRLLHLDKPFILLLPVSTICYQYFPKSEHIQLIIPPKRINFRTDGKSSATFDTIYICYKINLIKDIIFL
jgi:hypothetical protein